MQIKLDIVKRGRIEKFKSSGIEIMRVIVKIPEYFIFEINDLSKTSKLFSKLAHSAKQKKNKERLKRIALTCKLLMREKSIETIMKKFGITARTTLIQYLQQIDYSIQELHQKPAD